MNSETPMPIARSGQRPLWRRLIGPILVGVMLVIAFTVLDRMAGHMSFADVRAAMLATPDGAILLSILFTAISFGALAAYDVLAVRAAVRSKVPFRTAAFAGAAGYAFSNALGFPVMTGVWVRYRIYSVSGLRVVDITRVVTMTWVSFWFGCGLVIGAFVAIEPHSIAALLDMPPPVARLLGITVVGLVLLFVAWVSTGDRRVAVRRFHLNMPDRHTVIGQLAAGAVDFIGAGAALYVLLPEAAQPAIGTFTVVFVSALTLGIISHAPGGIGVFEATLVSGLGTEAGPALLGSLILFRVIYYLLPLACAAAAMAIAGVVLRLRRRR
ncbi:hypothetical protein L2U69_12865 [Zavarzinia compransoris]|uniref:hypothetical protein n=1 Tax=Zavarzinia marina TaxID=2911065 RepID=UPI001F386F53|nr:hypothetical protein [Zavarzinia marina]MCF4166538.1 hypothetical protein [Zavarzinia marina]